MSSLRKNWVDRTTLLVAGLALILSINNATTLVQQEKTLGLAAKLALLHSQKIVELNDANNANHALTAELISMMTETISASTTQNLRAPLIDLPYIPPASRAVLRPSRSDRPQPLPD